MATPASATMNTACIAPRNADSALAQKLRHIENADVIVAAQPQKMVVTRHDIVRSGAHGALQYAVIRRVFFNDLHLTAGWTIRAASRNTACERCPSMPQLMMEPHVRIEPYRIARAIKSFASPSEFVAYVNDSPSPPYCTI